MENSLRSSVECVPEVAAETSPGAPRSSSTEASAEAPTSSRRMALSATAVGDRAPLRCSSLAAYGQPGIETELDILDSELRMVMRQAGTPSLGRITKSYVRRPPNAGLVGSAAHGALPSTCGATQGDRRDRLWGGAWSPRRGHMPVTKRWTVQDYQETAQGRSPGGGTPASSIWPSSGAPASRQRSTSWTASCGW